VHKRTKLKLSIGSAVVVALLVVACANQPTPVAEKDVALLASTNGVAQVDGQINPSDVLQIRETVEPNTESELLTPAGAVSPQGDRIIQVLNSIQPERSVVALFARLEYGMLNSIKPPVLTNIKN
jgi:PBP1b-binding outer membrane lipoprotein LpoB